MALKTLGTNATTSLNAVTFQPDITDLTPADMSAIAHGIVGDGRFATSNPTGILATAATHSNTTLDTLVATGGAGLAAIQVGFLVVGVGIPPGTYVARVISATSVELSQAATATGTPRVAFVPANATQVNRFDQTQRLEIPGRGILIVKAGDVVAIDNTGWPILVSAAAIAYAGSQWTLT